MFKDWRREKRFLRKNGHTETYEAYQLGHNAAMYGNAMPKRLRTNPYPPGVRHDNWQRGYDQSDPMGERMGRNK